MAGATLLTLIDDIASVLDDVALMTKMAAKKTSGVLGDDLALNAQQVAGVASERELPVVWAVARGSMLNKAILVPSALAISALLPWAITPLLMLGGAYLCFEGFEKLAHRFLHSRDEDRARHAQRVAALADPAVDVVAMERERIKGAVRTDFILSAEIIVITLGTVATVAFAQQFTVLTIIAVLMTVGVYGLVAGIVKLDDAGLHLSRSEGWPARALGHGLLMAAPYLMKSLSVVGTAAMFMVGGGILSHGIPAAHAFGDHLEEAAAALLPAAGTGLRMVVGAAFAATVGIIAGGLILLAVKVTARFLPRARPAA